jgi:hypothetical protein
MDPSQCRRVSRRVARLPPVPPGSTAGERALLAALATESCLRTEPAASVPALASRAFERGLLADHAAYASPVGQRGVPVDLRRRL